MFLQVMDFKLSTRYLPLKLGFSVLFFFFLVRNLLSKLHEVHVFTKQNLITTYTLSKLIYDIRKNSFKYTLILV